MAVPIEGGTMSILVLSRRGSDLLYLPHQFDSALVTSAKGSSHSCIRVVRNPGDGTVSLALTTPYRYRWLVTHFTMALEKAQLGPLGQFYIAFEVLWNVSLVLAMVFLWR